MFRAEHEMLPPLLTWLERSGRLSPDSIAVAELAWFGRRIDLAILHKHGRSVAYELKMNKSGRAIEQAAYNRLSFDRSYVVTVSVPTEDTIAAARSARVGMILLTEQSVRVLLPSPPGERDPDLRRKLLETMRAGRNSSV